VKCYIWSIALYGAETWTLRAVDQKHLESFEMWCWRRMEKISWTDHVRNEKVLLRFKEQRNILHEIRKRKASWMGHILRRNCLLQRVIEGKIQGGIEVTGRRGRRRKKLLDDFNIHGSVHRNNILIYIQQDATLHSLFYLETAVHVLHGTTTHHQERKQLYLQHLVFVTPYSYLPLSWKSWNWFECAVGGVRHVL